MDVLPIITLERLTPLISFPPPLSALLRLNQDEIPFDLSTLYSRLLPLDEEALRKLTTSYLENVAVPSINETQKKKFAAYRTVPKKYSSVICALSHALYGDVVKTNDLVMLLRRQFLGQNDVSNLKKSKVRLEAILYVLCQANQGTIDIVVVSPRRDYASLYTSFSGHVLHESGDATRRTLVVLEYDADSDMWSPVNFNFAFASSSSAAPAAPQKATAPEPRDATDAAGDHPSSAAILRDGLAPRPKIVGLLPTAPPDDEAHSDADDAVDQKVVGAADLPPFALVVRQSDRRFHPNGHASSSPQPAGSPSSTAVDVLSPRGAVMAAGVSPELPIGTLKYPNLNMADFGVAALMIESASKHLPRTFSRFFSTSLLALVCLAVAVALLSILWGRDLRACCAESIHEASCWDLSSPSFVNLTIVANNTVEAACARRMCSVDGSIRTGAVYGFLYGTTLGIGRMVWVAIGASFFCWSASLLVNHFVMRNMSLRHAKPRFLYWLSFAHIIIGCGLCVVSAFILYIVVKTKSNGGAAFDCNWYSGAERAVCVTAQNSCSTAVRVIISSPTTSFALSVLLTVSSGVHLFMCLVPPLEDDEQRTKLPYATPDTSIFVPGIYAPDGISDEELNRLRLQLTLRNIGSTLRLPVHGSTTNVSRKDSNAPGTSSAARNRLTNALRNALKGVRVAAALRRKDHSADGAGDAALGDLGDESHGIHVAVHDSSESYQMDLKRRGSLTFIPRSTDAAQLSRSTLREVQRISTRVKHEIVDHGLPTSSGPEGLPSSSGSQGLLPHSVASNGGAISKYQEVENQIHVLQRVAMHRDAVLDAIVDRIGHRTPQNRLHGGDSHQPANLATTATTGVFSECTAAFVDSDDGD